MGNWVLAANTLNGQAKVNALLVKSGILYGCTGMDKYTECYLFSWNTMGYWEQAADYFPTERVGKCLATYNNKIYMGTSDAAGSPQEGGALLEWDGISQWVEVAPRYPFGAANHIFALIAFNGKLYGGCGNQYALLQEWNDVDAWTIKCQAPSSSQAVHSLIEYHGKLYAGTWPDGRLLEWDGFAAFWTVVAGTPTNTYDIDCLCIFNDEIYGGSAHDQKLFKWNGVDAWVLVASGTSNPIYSLVVHNGSLYGSSDGTQLLRWNNLDAWVQEAIYNGDSCLALIEYQTKIYSSTGGNGYLLEFVEGAPLPSVVVIPDVTSVECGSLDPLVFINNTFRGASISGNGKIGRGVFSSNSESVAIPYIIDNVGQANFGGNTPNGLFMVDTFGTQSLSIPCEDATKLEIKTEFLGAALFADFAIFFEDINGIRVYSTIVRSNNLQVALGALFGFHGSKIFMDVIFGSKYCGIVLLTDLTVSGSLINAWLSVV